MRLRKPTKKGGAVKPVAAAIRTLKDLEALVIAFERLLADDWQ